MRGAHRKLRHAFTLVIVGISILFAFGEMAVASFPPLTGRVVDQANILSAPTKLMIISELERFEGEDQGPQLVVVTVDSLEGKSIEDYALDLGRLWKIGHAAKNNGIILLIAPNEREVRIEVGYGLEGVLTDAAANQIIRKVLVPELRDNHWDAAAKAGVKAIINEIKSPQYQEASELDESHTSAWWLLAYFVLLFFSKYIRYVFALCINLVLTILLIAPLNAILWLFGRNPITFKGLPLPSRGGKNGGSGGGFWGGFGGGSGGSGGGFSGGGGSFGGGGSSGRF